MNTDPQKVLDHYLHESRRNRNIVDVFLRGGTRLSGRIRAFDQYSILLERHDTEYLIYKSAIATVNKLKTERP